MTPVQIAALEAAGREELKQALRDLEAAVLADDAAAKREAEIMIHVAANTLRTWRRAKQRARQQGK